VFTWVVQGSNEQTAVDTSIGWLSWGVLVSSWDGFFFLSVCARLRVAYEHMEPVRGMSSKRKGKRKK